MKTTAEAATTPRPAAGHVRILFWTIAWLVCMLAWDASGLDLPVARWFGSPSGFPLREHWFFVGVMHELARRLAWVLVAVLIASIWLPLGPLRGTSRGARIQLAATTLLSLAVVSTLKYTSSTSCPWDLSEFGGVARHVSHWALGVLDGGGGKCFPAGHASAGFAFFGGFFALRRQRPPAAQVWLVATLLAGLLLGWAQQVRGAHFLSHTLWTGWLCWCTAWLVDLGIQVLQRRPRRQARTSVSSDAVA